MDARNTESMRLFLTLWPDDATRTGLMHLQAPLKGRIVPYGNLHLTLAFLGQQPAGVVDLIRDILPHLTSPAVSLTLDRLGYFPRNRIAWIGMHETPDALVTLQREASLALRQHGVTFDDKENFKPHITLARDATLPQDICFQPVIWRASEVALVESVTRAEGSVYRVLASRSLDKACLLPDQRREWN